MAKCDYCGSSILFGGENVGDYRFCNATCHEQGYLIEVADQVPEDIMAQQLVVVHQGECPQCGGEGPIDVHTSHTVWSLLLLTSWKSSPRVCCRSCGVKSKLGAAVFSGVLGWWGIPWGILMTPVQVGRNLIGVFSSPDPSTPSEQLQTLVKLDLAQRVVAANQEAAAEEAG